MKLTVGEVRLDWYDFIVNWVGFIKTMKPMLKLTVVEVAWACYDFIVNWFGFTKTMKLTACEVKLDWYDFIVK